MNIDHNRIKVADLEKNQPNKILTTNDNGELEFSDINNIKTESYNALDYTAEGKALDARQGKILKDLIDTINVLLASDNINLNTIQELANAIESIQNSLNSILVNDLTTGGNTKALTAEMGKSLKGLYDTLVTTAGGKEDVSNKSQDIETDKTSTSKYSSVKQLYDWAVAKFVQAANIKTVNGNNLIGTGNITTPDMTTNTAQEVTALKTFRAGMFGLRNTANTFTSFFASAVTASRTWTWPDKSGTVAMTSDIVAQLNGTVNFLVKFGTATTGTLSRLFDNGTCFGIGTVNTPTKDITLGNQQNREIAIEESDSLTKGRDLSISAGKTINYQLSSNFIDINQAPRNWRKGCADTNKNKYIPSGTSLYKQTNGTGDFVLYYNSVYNINSVAINNSGDIYIATSNGLYKQTGSTGAFVLESGITNRNYYSMSFHQSGDLYAVCSYSDNGAVSSEYIYKRVSNSGDFVPVSSTLGRYNDISCAPNGDVYASLWSVGLVKQTGGTGPWTTIFSNSSLGTVCVLANGTIYTANVYGATLPNFYISTNNGSSFSTSIIGGAIGYAFFSANGNNIYQYKYVGTSSITMQNNDVLGISNLDGGTLKLKSGTGKGTGKSRYEIYTGQKTISGTSMQLETLRAYFDENGFFIYLTPPIYANDADADADSNLPSGAYYKVTGNRTLFQKP